MRAVNPFGVFVRNAFDIRSLRIVFPAVFENEREENPLGYEEPDPDDDRNEFDQVVDLCGIAGSLCDNVLHHRSLTLEVNVYGSTNKMTEPANNATHTASQINKLVEKAPEYSSAVIVFTGS